MGNLENTGEPDSLASPEGGGCSRDLADDERPTANDDLGRGNVLGIALVLKLAEKFFLLQ